MPIEIRELVIKAVVQQDNGAAATGPSGSSAGDNDQNPGEELMNKCIDKITEILKQRNER